MSIPPIKNGRKNEVEKNIHSSSKVAPFSNGSSKKKRQLNCSLVFLLVFLLFYSGSKHKQWMKLWFLTCPMPDLSGRINFDPFSKTWNFFALEIPMKYSKNGKNFAMSKNTSNVLIVTCWTLCTSLGGLVHDTLFWRTHYSHFLPILSCLRSNTILLLKKAHCCVTPRGKVTNKSHAESRNSKVDRRPKTDCP